MWKVFSLKDFQVFLKCATKKYLAFYCQSSHTARFVKPHKRKGVIERSRHFVDYVKITVVGGNGGNGMISFSSLPNLEWAGPDGGNGGNGGHVVFKASHNVKSLSHLNAVIMASQGVKGKTSQRDGKNASHLIIDVPIGTVIKAETGMVLASLDENDSIYIAARGGAGGRGNYSFLSNENRAPVMAEKGGIGQEREIHVELKIMAHAGLIGFPNAGKSSLLRAISRAQPKVSPYPFTTLNPHIGMVLYDDHQQLAVADIPGLIAGSHLNKGMGHSFLRHIERCLCLIYVIDLSLEQPWQQLMQLQYELNQYKNGLADRPALLVANKIDLPGAEKKLNGLKNWMWQKRNERNKNIESDDVINNNRDDLFKYSTKLFENITGTITEQNFVSVDNKSSEVNSISDYSSVKGYRMADDKNLSEIEESWKITPVSENDIDSLQYELENDTGIKVLGVSAKRELGIESLLHHLRVIYDSHLASSSNDQSRNKND